MYKNKSLSINGDKTEFMNLYTENDEDEYASFTIPDDKGNIINQKYTIKILGYTVNKNNDLKNHISALYGKVNNTYHKIKGALPFLSQKN